MTVEPKIVVGVVESFAGARKSGQWTLIVFINPWRDENGVIKTDSLRLASKRPIKEADIQLAREHYQYEGSAWRFTIVERQAWNELIEIGDKVADPDLDRTLEEWHTPTVIKDEVLGSLTLDRKSDWYEGNWAFSGQTCVLNVDRSRQGDVEDVVRAREPILRLEAQTTQIHDALATLVELYNDTWQCSGKPLEREEFLMKTPITAIVAHANGDLTLYFDDGGLFLDHCIEVRIDDSGEFISASLAG